MPSAVSIKELWKEYQIGGSRPAGDTFYDVLAGALRRPFSRRSTVATDFGARDRFWALQDINVDIQPGEVVGVIGRNGAGKSTLLKVLSRITAPTRGHVEVRGRLASLLEVGTGFHAELTGRENVFLNGAILGMSRRDIARKFDEIVAFAEVDKFIDTPVKRYSSGMYVRLAFSVAAHLDADVLLVDEVLAVGDIAFQQKCIGEMGRVSANGRTVVVVSHQMDIVSRLCKRILTLQCGQLISDLPVGEAISEYFKLLANPNGVAAALTMRGPIADAVTLHSFRLKQEGGSLDALDPTRSCSVELRGYCHQRLHHCDLNLVLMRDGIAVASLFDTAHAEPLMTGDFHSSFEIRANTFVPGRYQFKVGLVSGSNQWATSDEVLSFEVSAVMTERAFHQLGLLQVDSRAKRMQSGDSGQFSIKDKATGIQ